MSQVLILWVFKPCLAQSVEFGESQRGMLANISRQQPDAWWDGSGAVPCVVHGQRHRWRRSYEGVSSPAVIEPRARGIENNVGAAGPGGCGALGARQTRCRHPLVPHQAGPRWRAASVPGPGVPAAPQLSQGALAQHTLHLRAALCDGRLAKGTRLPGSTPHMCQAAAHASQAASGNTRS